LFAEWGGHVNQRTKIWPKKGKPEVKDQVFQSAITDLKEEERKKKPRKEKANG